MKRANGKDWGTGVPDRVFGINYSWDYKQHDMDYAIDSGVPRLEGDVKLFKAMIKSGRSTSLASSMKKKPIKALAQSIWSPIWALGNFVVLRLVGWTRYGKGK